MNNIRVKKLEQRKKVKRKHKKANNDKFFCVAFVLITVSFFFEISSEKVLLRFLKMTFKKADNQKPSSKDKASI